MLVRSKYSATSERFLLWLCLLGATQATLLVADDSFFPVQSGAPVVSEEAPRGGAGATSNAPPSTNSTEISEPLPSNSSQEDGPRDRAPSSALKASVAKTEAVKVPAAIERRIPGREGVQFPFPPFVYESLPNIESSGPSFVPVPDRWRLLYTGKWYDPYHQNIAKADLPIAGHGDHLWFVEASAVLDMLAEARRIPLPVGGVSTEHPESNNTFGNGRNRLYVVNFAPSIGIIEGNTSFKPPDWEFRVTPVFNFNYLDADEEIVRIDPTAGSNRDDSHIGFSELFVDKHLFNISPRFDFVSARVGVQRFVSDFRGFVFSDEAPGVRLFGNWDNNKWQYNLAYFRRLNKDTNSGVNTVFDDRFEDVVVANLFRQDALFLGHQIQGSVIYRGDTAGSHPKYFDNNGFLIRPASIGDERPKNVYTTYLGLNADGHFGRLNNTFSYYYVLGQESHNQIAQRSVDIRAQMLATEFSYDIDWLRLRASFFWASGDSDARDGKATGFDAIFDNPNFAGGDLGFLQRQGFPLIGGGGVNLFNRNSLLPDLRAGKEEGQSNFVNPGLFLYNLGADVEVLPELRVITNASFMQFDKVGVLKTVRQDRSIGRDIGLDLSAGILYRPFMHQNIQIRAGASTLLPASGVDDLFGDKKLYTLFTNLILVY